MKTNKKNISEIGISLVFIILLSSYISAFGLGFLYTTDNPLELSKGQTEEVSFRLQNIPATEDITLRPAILKGSEIIELVDSNDVLVPAEGTKYVNAVVTIPSDAQIGDTYPVEITFTTVTETAAGTFGLGSSISRSFNVVIIPTEEERARLAEEGVGIPLWIYLIVGIVILALIILIVWLKKRKKINP